MEVIESELNLLKPKLCNDNNNAQRRRLHVENELLQLRLSNIALDGLQSEERFRRISDDIESVRQSVKLLYDSRRITFLDVIWEIIRLVAIWTFLIYTGTKRRFDFFFKICCKFGLVSLLGCTTNSFCQAIGKLRWSWQQIPYIPNRKEINWSVVFKNSSTRHTNFH